MKTLKQTRQGFICLFGSALVLAILIRLGLCVMDITGLHNYDYISGHGKTLFDTICTILTGSSLFALLAISGLIMTLSTLAPVVYAVMLSKGEKSFYSPKKALIIGALTTLTGFICFALCLNGVFSGVQFDTIMSKSSGGLGSLIMLLCLFVTFTSLIAAASMVLSCCVHRAQKSKSKFGVASIVIPAVLACGLIVLVFTIISFAQFNQASLHAFRISLVLCVDILVNLCILLIAYKLIRKK